MKYILPKWLTLYRMTLIVVTFFIVLSLMHLWSYFHVGNELSDTHLSNLNKPKIANAINRDRIKSSPYFGQYLPDDEKAIQQSDLDVSLVGVLYSENPDESQAIIRQSNQEEKYYYINDTLPGGAVVKKITENSVIVLFDGKLQKLSLPKDSLTFGPKPKAQIIKE